MNNLLNAAKNVVEDLYNLNYDKVVNLSNLEQAIERAEKQAVDIDSIIDIGEEKEVTRVLAMKIAFAAQQTERERIKNLLKQSEDWFEDEQMVQAKWLLDKIDER